jgi:hypothetical protein
MQECDKDGNLKEGSTPKNLERDFGGLRYSKIEGIEAVGAAKNIYTESYSDANKLRVYVPEEIKHKETSIKLTLWFVGETRQSDLDRFNSYIINGLHRYWDTARNKWFAFYVKDELKPADSQWYGSTPFLKMEYNLINIFGKTFDIDNN